MAGWSLSHGRIATIQQKLPIINDSGSWKTSLERVWNKLSGYQYIILPGIDFKSYLILILKDFAIQAERVGSNLPGPFAIWNTFSSSPAGNPCLSFKPQLQHRFLYKALQKHSFPHLTQCTLPTAGRTVGSLRHGHGLFLFDAGPNH